MEKALEILKCLKYDYSICDNNMILDNKYTNVLVDEAISELEAVTNRSCTGCVYNKPENVNCIYCARNCRDYYDRGTDE